MRTNQIIYITTVIISILIIASIISIAFFTWPKADDISLLLQIKERGIFQHIVKSYYSWDGRVITLGIIQSIFIKYLPVEITNAIWASCLVLTAFVSLKIFVYLSAVINKFTSSSYVIGTAVFSSIFWYGYKNHISDTVYWATGGIYIISLLFTVLWLYLWFTIFSFTKTIRPLPRMLFYLFTIYVGALSQNLSTAILAFVGMEMLHAILTKNVSRVKNTVVIIILLLMGLFIIVLAPGNFIRSAYGKNSFIVDPHTLFSTVSTILLYHIRQSIPLFLLTILSLPLVTIYYLRASNQKIKKQITIYLTNNHMITIVKVTRFLPASLASIVPFVFVPDFLSPRATIYFMTFFVFWIYFDIIPLFLKHIAEPAPKRHIQKHNWPYICIIVFLISIFSITLSHIIALYQIKKDILKREKIIMSYANKNMDVITYPIETSTLPFSYIFSDITTDQNHWINHTVAKSYNIKSIRALKHNQQVLSPPSL